MFNFGKNLPAAALKHVDRISRERSPALISSSRGQPYIPKPAFDRKEIKGFNDSENGCIVNTMSGDSFKKLHSARSLQRE